MSKPTTLQIDLYRGDTYSWEFAFTSAGVEEDITGWTLYFTVKRDIDDDDTDAIIQKIITSHTDPTHGITQLSLSHVETAAMPVGYWVYDIQIKTATDEVYTIYKGGFKVLQDVTLEY